LKEIKKTLDITTANVESAYKVAYPATDREVMATMRPDETSGCTAVTAIIRKRMGERFIHCANLGDSRAVLVRKGKGIRLTYDHKASDEAEIKMVEDRGGMVIQARVGGALGITRAFGDAELKRKGWLSTDPFTSTIKIEEGDTHLVIACDGLFDVATDDKVAELVTPIEDGQEASEALVKYALEKETRDNVSVIVVVL